MLDDHLLRSHAGPLDIRYCVLAVGTVRAGRRESRADFVADQDDGASIRSELAVRWTIPGIGRAIVDGPQIEW
jgi:hypothetical protein